jgi:hypothetical protein
LAGPNAVYARDFFRLRRRSGWNAPQSLATKIPFPKSTDVSFEGRRDPSSGEALPSINGIHR